jgi:hypothetical protein
MRGTIRSFWISAPLTFGHIWKIEHVIGEDITLEFKISLIKNPKLTLLRNADELLEL